MPDIYTILDATQSHVMSRHYYELSQRKFILACVSCLDVVMNFLRESSYRRAIPV